MFRIRSDLREVSLLLLKAEWVSGWSARMECDREGCLNTIISVIVSQVNGEWVESTEV